MAAISIIRATITAGGQSPMQSAIPCVLIGGGISKGAYFLSQDLPADRAARDAVLFAVMGSPEGDDHGEAYQRLFQEALEALT